MGGKSTSHSAVLSGKKPSASSAFDMHSWQGLTEVLKKGKESLKDPASYAEFRNLVLEYAQRGGDVELRKQIDDVIATFGKSVESATSDSRSENVKRKRKKRKKKNKNQNSDETQTVELTQEKAVATLPVNQRRIKPNFKKPLGNTVSKPTEPPRELPVESEDEPVIIEDKVPSPLPVTKGELTQTPILQSVPSSPVREHQPEKQKHGVHEEVFDNSSGPAQEYKSIEEHKQRIREIKRIVHEEIGNPAALVSTHNEFGKQYMMALLGALKSTSPGSAEGPDSAMQKLEDAFEALRSSPVDEVPEKDEQSLEVKVEPTAKSEVKPTPQILPKEPVIVPKSKPIVEEVSAPKAAVPPKPEPVSVSQPAPKPIIEKELELKPVVSPKPEPVAVPKPTPTPVIEKNPEPKPTPTPAVASKLEPTATASPKPDPVSTPQPSVPQTKEEFLKKIQSKSTPVVPPKPEPVVAPKSEPRATTHSVSLKPSEPNVKNENNSHNQDKSQKSNPITNIKKPEIDTDSDSDTQKTKLSPASTLAALLKRDISKKDEEKKSEKAIYEIPPEQMFASIKTEGERRKISTPQTTKTPDTGYRPFDAVDTNKFTFKQTELSSPKVNQALHQLLDEWSIFKSGGFFGMGPGGSEHPIYQTIAPLSMGEVISGRWEGSNREVIKTIKEYVDAWRHEQGVAYTMQETFEHYLRRVILRIQQRQSGS